MTVVSCIISGKCVTHASDSLLTRTLTSGVVEELEWEDPKLVKVEPFGGVLGYYGFAGMSRERSTLRWLRREAAQAAACSGAQEFAARLAERCERWLRAEGARKDRTGGIGIHFTAYEWSDGYWTPELFHITNWGDPSYAALKTEGVVWTRNTYATMTDSPIESKDSDAGCRARVREFLAGEGYFRFNNGDPEMYNAVANTIHDAGVLVLKRVGGGTATLEAAHWTSLCRRPVEIVGDLQRDLAGPGRRRVGGRTHDVTVKPPREFATTTGVT